MALAVARFSGSSYRPPVEDCRWPMAVVAVSLVAISLREM
jgi:hypothetical protein